MTSSVLWHAQGRRPSPERREPSIVMLLLLEISADGWTAALAMRQAYSVTSRPCAVSAQMTTTQVAMITTAHTG